MTKLKTLKDLPFLFDGTIKENKCYFEKELKAEAIKWVNGEGQFMKVKSIRESKCPKCGGKLEYSYEKTYDCSGDCEEYWDVWQLFLIEIFNISGEDLK